MNEESIIYIINYFNQYPDQSPEVLVKNIISSGYNMTDLKEALRRLGISPIVIPGYVEPEPPPPKPLLSRNLIFVLCVIGLVLLVIGSGFLLLGPKKEKKPESSGKIQQTIISEPSQKPTSAILIPTVNPEFSESDMFDITVTGNVLVHIIDKNQRRIGAADITQDAYKEISGAAYIVEDDKSNNPGRVIYKTTVSGLPGSTEYYSILLQFRDAFRSLIKITARSNSTPKETIVFHDVKQVNGYQGILHFIPKDGPEQLQLAVIDSTGSAQISIDPTYILNSVESTDVIKPATKFLK